MTLRCGILTLKTSDSFFRSFRFLRQNEAFSATEQNQTYNHSFFLEDRVQLFSKEISLFWRFSFQIKTTDFWTIPSSSNPNTNFHLEPKAENQKFEIEENVMSEPVKMPNRHFLRRDYLHIFFYLKFWVFVSLAPQIN